MGRFQDQALGTGPRGGWFLVIRKDGRRRGSREDTHSRSSGTSDGRIRNLAVVGTFCPGMVQPQRLIQRSTAYDKTFPETAIQGATTAHSRPQRQNGFRSPIMAKRLTEVRIG